MLAYPAWLLHRARTHGQAFFLQFGLHCATHQIRVILISCVVITSLFYPALDLYISSRSSSQSIVETLITPNYAPDYSDLVDLWSGYDTLRVHHDSRTRLQCRDGQTLRVERILIETHLVEDDAAANHQILLSTLDLESRLQRLITKSDSPCLKTANDQCLVVSPLAFWNYDKESIRYDTNILDTLSYSKNVSVAGVPITPHMVLAGRASLEDGAGNWFDSARFLALTYFFPQNTCVRSGSESAQWAQLVQKAVPQNADVTVQVPESTLIALEYNPQRSESRKGWSAISAFLYIAYTGFTVYVVWSVRKMDSVHSRVGVTFTALVEIAVSTITSLSVCALVGFKITMVPWELLPIVIVFVGAENMFNLVDAVGKTSISLSVKQRIAEGLSRAGTSNTLKVVSYNAILGVIAVFSFGAVRQFCIFAIVVLVAHWFLAHTFFMAVLSIDVARLELEELLRHDQSLAQVAPQSHEDGRDQSAKQPRSGWQKLVFTLQSLLKGRAATNISLVMLLAIAATLYYTTYTTSPTITPPHVKHRGAVLRSKMREPAAQAAVVVSTAEQIWKTLNPAQTPLLHLRVELPTVITFSPDADSATSMLGYQARYTTLTFKFVLWLLTIVVLPIAATTSALWGLLLYLLKNTELLEAQRHRLDGDTPLNSHGKEDERTLQGNITFSTLPRAFASDVELIAASKDGRVVVSVGLHNEITVWNADTRKHVSINAEDILLRIANTSSCAVSTVTCVSVDEDGRYFAVGTGAGLIAGWSIDRGTGFVRALPVLALDNSSASVTEVRFVPTAPLAPYDSKIGIKRKKTPTPTHGRTPPPANSSATSEPNSPESKSRRGVTLLATYESGVAARWSIADFPTVSFFSPSRPSDATVVRALLMPVLPDDRVLVAFCLDDGTLDIVETGEYTPTMLAECILQAGDPLDLVWVAHACRTEISGSVRVVVATATEAGAVSLWDGQTGECISILESPSLAPTPHGRISRLRVCPVQSETCHFCGQLPMESLAVAYSDNSASGVVRFAKLYVEEDHHQAPTQTSRRCSCARAHHQQQSGLRRVSSRDSLAGSIVPPRTRSRSNSNASSSQLGSPRIPRARLATAFEASTAAAFPVSGHGVHSRRASEKEKEREKEGYLSRRSSELLLSVPFPVGSLAEDGGDYDLGAVSPGAGNVMDLTRSGATTPTHSHSHSGSFGTLNMYAYSVWRNAVVVPLEDVMCERGGWDVMNGLVVGIRRKPRIQGKPKIVPTVSSLAPPNSSSSHGLSTATLERWEMWAFDPALSLLRSSVLSTLPLRAGSSSEGRPSSPSFSFSSTPAFSFTSRTKSSADRIARLPFTRVSPLLIMSEHALAGFGNTVGLFSFSS